MGKLSGETVGESSDRAAMAERHAALMKPMRDRQLWEARAELVRKYRARPATFPDGIDTKYDRWYRAEEWTDDGQRITATGETEVAAPDVTEIQVNVTEKAVTENDPSSPLGGENDPVTKKRGRPSSDVTMSSAERVRAYRAKRSEAAANGFRLES